MATGILLIQLRGGIIPPLFLTIILGNILNVYGGYKILHGILDMISIKINSKFYAIGLGVFVVIHTYFTYSQSNVAARIMNYSFFTGLMFLSFCYMFIKYSKERLEISLIMILISYAINILILSVRFINAVGYEDISVLFRGAIIFKTFILTSIMTTIIRAISIIVYKTKDLIE